MRSLYGILLFLLLGVPAAFAQSSLQISGHVRDVQGAPVIGATLRLEGSSTGTVTDAQGAYTLKPAAAGAYRLTVSFIGYNTLRQQVQVGSAPLKLDLTLQEAVSELQSVEIVGRKEDSYRNTTSFIGSKTQTALRDLPQSVSYVTKELIQDQGLMRTGEVLKNMSGVNQFTIYDDISIRGFRVGSGGTQLVNGMRTTTGFWKQPLVNYLERVEVLKGPSSALFGNASPGGVVNRVTKKPLDEYRNSLSVSLGSFHNFRALADFTGPANKSKTLLYRLNVGFEDAQSFRDLQFDRNLVIAPSISFIPSEKTRVNLDFVYNTSDSRLDRGQSSFSDDLYATPTSLSLNTSNDYLKEKTYTISASLQHRFTDALSLNASYMRTGYDEDLLEHRSSNVYAVDGAGKDIPNLAARQVFMRKRARYVDNFGAYFLYKAETGVLKHQLVLGYDHATEQMAAGSSQLTASGYRNAANNGSIAKYDPAKKHLYLLDANGNPVPNVPHFDLNDPVASNRMQDMSKYFYATRGFDPTRYQLHGLYLQDQITWGRLQAMIGLRYETYVDYVDYRKATEKKVVQSALLPRLGLVFKASEQINLYGTYVQGYNPQTASTIANPNAGGPFDPLESDMMEVGAKTEWFGKRLEVNTALYSIRQKNTLYPVAGETDLLEQIGEERAQGVEVDVTGRLLPNWSITAAYAYNDARITESPDASELGRQKPNAPKHQGSFWTRYQFEQGPLKGLGLAFGANYVGDRNLSHSSTQTIPSYFLMNAAMFYTSGNLRLQLNLNNLANKTYWVGGYDYLRLFPGAPRNLMGTVSYSF